MPLLQVAIGRMQPDVGSRQVTHVRTETAHLELGRFHHIVGKNCRETKQMTGSINRDAIQRDHIPAEVAAADIDGRSPIGTGRNPGQGLDELDIVRFSHRRHLVADLVRAHHLHAHDPADAGILDL